MKSARPIILVVEDYDDTRDMLRSLLEKRGCHVVEAENGQAAVDLAMQANPGLILMDLDMPVLDGYEATRQILARQDVHVIALSVHCGGEGRQQARDAGCLECYLKPLDNTVLDDLLARYFPKQH